MESNDYPIRVGGTMYTIDTDGPNKIPAVFQTADIPASDDPISYQLVGDTDRSTTLQALLAGIKNADQVIILANAVPKGTADAADVGGRQYLCHDRVFQYVGSDERGLPHFLLSGSDFLGKNLLQPRKFLYAIGERPVFKVLMLARIAK